MNKKDFTLQQFRLNLVYNYFLANPKVALDYFKTVYSTDYASLCEEMEMEENPYVIVPTGWDDSNTELEVKELVTNLQMHLNKGPKNIYKDLVPDHIPSYLEIAKLEIDLLNVDRDLLSCND